eukprot:XP_011426729.1 PREDICTED: uncharacterized protein LOC105327802 isoform X1 [Crassostrea gigas]
MEVDIVVSCVLIFSFTFLCPYVRGNLFKEVSSCPSDGVEWRERAQKKQCREPIPDFMCAAIENQPGRFGEICTIAGLSTAGFCAVLDEDTYNLNYIKCVAASGCPATAYRSSEVYRYEACYRSETSTPSTYTVIQNKLNTTRMDIAEQVGSFNAVTFIIYICFILVFLVIFIFWTKRKLFKHRESSENLFGNGNRISLLGNYMTSRLVAFCHADLDSLRYKMVTHSESLKHHFKETLCDPMVYNEDDLKKFDLDVVYILLTNFCDIPCPDNGWGNMPGDEDLSLGSDIERVRILVNEYLDNKTLNVDEVNQILGRWENFFGVINQDDYIEFCPEKKIIYVKVKPNNVIENGVLVTQDIANILEKMKSKKVVICRGAIGCGKTTALEYVTKKYREDGWTIEWMDVSLDESCIERLPIHGIEKTVICIDNLFGVFGCQVFVNDLFNKFKRFMRKIVNRGKQPMVLLGIHQHVFEDISPENNPFPKDESLFIDLNKISQSEALQIYKLQQKNNKSKQGDISVEDFLRLIEQRSSEVGTPFQTLMISAAPGVFGNKWFCSQPFQTLTEHFNCLYNTERELFCSLFYIMCVTIFNPRADELDMDVVNAISTSLNRNTIAYYLSQLAPYTHDDGNVIEIKHDLITIALIHALIRKSENPWKVLKVYDNTKTLELVRPDDPYARPHKFAVPLRREMFAKALSVLEEKTFYEN